MTDNEHWGYKEVGYKYTTGTGFVTPGELDLFCAASGVRQDIFISDEAGKALGARARIIPAVFLIPAIVFRLLKETGLIKSGNIAELIFPVAPASRSANNVIPSSPSNGPSIISPPSLTIGVQLKRGSIAADPVVLGERL